MIDIELLNSFCDEAIDLLNRWEFVCLELSKNADDQSFQQELFRIAHNLKGGSKAVGLDSYGEFVHKIEDGITLVRDGNIKCEDKVITLLLASQKILLDWAQGLKTDPNFNVIKIESFLSEFNNVFFKKSDNKIVHNNEHSIEQNSSVIKSNSENRINTNAKNKINTKTVIASNETIRVSAQKLDQLIQTIGELSIHQSIVWHTKGESSLKNKIFSNSLQLSQKLTKELYDKALSLRMQPLNSVFQRLERVLIELSKNLEKQLNVVITGGDVELDKTVIEKIIDPLTHIVRNAVDHGIELSADRIIAGKNQFGTVRISAFQDTFGIIIIIQDDGKGLSTEKILKKAKEKKLVSEDGVINREEIFNLIFLPGFSTSEKITDVSGRGVGMDVVSKSLEELNGTIKIDSTEGVGTTFTITLPTSVSIIEAMIINLSGHNYVVPVGAIEEIFKLSTIEYNPSQNMIKLRDQVIPIKDLNEVLINKRDKKELLKEDKSLLIVKRDRKRVGFLVDKVLGQQQIVIRPLNEIINGSYGLMGGTILGNGEPGLIVDLQGIASDFINANGFKEMSI